MTKMRWLFIGLPLLLNSPVLAQTPQNEPPAPPPQPAAVNADQNLAEMAQRLEAALRRPASAGETVAPPVAPGAMVCGCKR